MLETPALWSQSGRKATRSAVVALETVTVAHVKPLAITVVAVFPVHMLFAALIALEDVYLGIVHIFAVNTITVHSILVL